MDIKPERRWFRYSLRTLLIAVTIAGAGFGWLGYKVRQKQHEQELVEAIRELGGIAEYDFQEGHSDHTFKATPPGPAWLRNLLGDNFFASVVNVRLSGPAIPDEVMIDLQRLPKLDWLNVCDTSITNAGLANLRGLTELRALHLNGTHVTDSGLVHLQRMPNLETLGLSHTQVSDAGLIHLRQMRNLRHLFLIDTQVTDQGCQNLQKALPDLQIIRRSVR